MNKPKIQKVFLLAEKLKYKSKKNALAYFYIFVFID